MYESGTGIAYLQQDHYILKEIANVYPAEAFICSISLHPSFSLSISLSIYKILYKTMKMVADSLKAILIYCSIF